VCFWGCGAFTVYLNFNVSFNEFFGKSLSEKCIVNSSLAAIAVPEMDGRQMRLISYSGDQKLLQIR
jgi:hypothetical protein